MIKHFQKFANIKITFCIGLVNEATSNELLLQTTQQIINLITKYSGGEG